MRAFFFLLVPLLFLGGCSDFSFYWQALKGQLNIVRLRRPIHEVLADPKVDKETKSKLRLVMKAQEFGRLKLALPEGATFNYYADLERKYVVWNVIASEKYRFKEYKNCYWIVGCLGYRGFFEKAEAEAFAKTLETKGFDVAVYGVRAYSTLGWFDDPVLNTFLSGSRTSLVSTVIHEQSHQVLFIKGDTAFNESFARFVEFEGLKRFLKSGGFEGKNKRPPAEILKRYRDYALERTRFQNIVLRGKARLEKLYASGLNTEDMALEKQRLFKEMAQDYQKEKKFFKITNYEGWFKRVKNNAHLMGFNQYHSLVNAFEQLFEQEGRDFALFYQAVKKLGALPLKERSARLKILKTLAAQKEI